MSQSTGIHCKVVWNDQIRRFQFSGTEFSSLQDQVKQLLGLNREFVLKYKDNEDDMITVSSTEELACAIDIARKNEGGLIRFTVFAPEAPLQPPQHLHPPHHPEFAHHHPHPHPFPHHPFPHPPASPDEDSEFPSPPENYCPYRGGRGRGGRFGHHGGNRWHREVGEEFPCQGRIEKKRAKMTFKRDMFKAYLTSLEQQSNLSPEEERKKLFLREKVNRLEQFLSTLSSPPPMEKEECLGEKDRCNRKSWKKCQRKQRCKNNKKEAKDSFISEEAKAEIKKLKGQIKEKKPALWVIQSQLKEKKIALRDASEKDQKEKVQFLKNEIAKLKQDKKEKKAEIFPLRQRIRQLKGEI